MTPRYHDTPLLRSHAPPTMDRRMSMHLGRARDSQHASLGKSSSDVVPARVCVLLYPCDLTDAEWA